jgi:lipopolysaccharide export LptBFGC system permease protein LptF
VEDPLQTFGKRVGGFVVLFSVLAIVMIILYVYRECEWIALRSAGQESCGTGFGWAALAGVFMVIAIFFGYRVFGKSG